jgi:hypothetical protein
MLKAVDGCMEGIMGESGAEIDGFGVVLLKW